ncbi:MAG: ArnT family glycosyltransferase [Gemmatimonadota bacterium]
MDPGGRPFAGGGGSVDGGEERARSPVLMSVALAVVAFIWLLPGLGRVGLTWDEPRYFDSASRIQEWTAAVTRGPERRSLASAERIREVWDAEHYWNPHPPVYKEGMALAEWISSRWLDPIRGFRLASLVWFALLVGGATWVGGRVWGTTSGAAAGLSLLLLPRAVGHAHIAATDTPLTLFWFVASAGLALYLLEGRRGYLVVGAVGLGLAMGTKFTGYLLPLPLLGWLLVYRRSARAALAFVGWIAGGLAVSYLLNPLAWHDPAGYAARLFSESLSRQESVPINTYYLGTQYEYVVPWHHPIVMTVVTVPLALLVLAIFGAARSLARPGRNAMGGLCLAMIVFFWALLALPSSPNHDGVRLFLPMFPFLALLAGRGFGAFHARLGRVLPARAGVLATLLLGLLFFYPPYLQLTRIAPFYLSYYNEVIGGPRGAARIGMEVSYWYDAVTPDFLERVNEYLPEDAQLATFPRSDYFRSLQAYRLLREDIRISQEWPPPYYLLVARKAVFGAREWGIYNNVRPVLAAAVDEVELVGLYVWKESGEPGQPGPKTASRRRQEEH